MRRGLGIWLVLVAVYAATLGLHASDGSRYTAAEAHRLLVAASIVHDADLNVRNQYRERVWRDWYPHRLRPAGQVVGGRLLEPAGLGLPLLLAPAYAIAGPTGAELWCAMLLAAAFACAAALAGRLVPEPWATRAALAGGLSPPAIAASTTVAPEAAAALLVTGAALLALRIRERPRLRWTFLCALLIALTPWVSLRAAAPAAVVAVALARWLRRRQRGLAGFVALEVIFTSLVVYVSIDDRLFGGLTPQAARRAGGSVTGAESVGDYLARVPRLAGELVDADVGLLRWAPLFALAGVALWALARARRDRLSVALPDVVDLEVAGGLLGVVAAAGLGVGAFAHRALDGPWLVVPDLVVVLPALAALAAAGWRRAPRAGAVLAILTLAASVWLLVGARVDRDGTQLAPPKGALPWGAF